MGTVFHRDLALLKALLALALGGEQIHLLITPVQAAAEEAADVPELDLVLKVFLLKIYHRGDRV